MSPSKLFNCLPNFEAPDWSQWARLEVSGVVFAEREGAGTHCVAGQSAERAHFFTVYGRQHADEGGIELADAITDCGDGTEALAVAAKLCRLSGLPLTLDPALSGEA